MSALVRWFAVLMLMVSIGLHTIVIQSAAWAGMLVSYSVQKGSVVQGVADTFDGRHACPMCKLAQATRETSDASDSKPASVEDGRLKLQLIMEAMPQIVFTPPPAQAFFPVPDVHAEALNDAPRTPPPRLGLLA